MGGGRSEYRRRESAGYGTALIRARSVGEQESGSPVSLLLTTNRVTGQTVGTRHYNDSNILTDRRGGHQEISKQKTRSRCDF